MIKAIIFDCFGVLTTERWLLFLAELPDSVDLEEVRSVHRAYTAGIISKKECDDRIHELTGQSFREAEDLGVDEIAKNTVLLDYIRELRGKSYDIGLLSNIATPWITDSFLTADEQELFDEMILSFEVGITKPDPRIFMLACERLRVGPHEAVLVDDIDRYCAAARAEGLHAIQYQDFKQMKYELEIILAKKS
jgi:HAD superfamily hydrolase (TIGR01509 family)